MATTTLAVLALLAQAPAQAPKEPARDLFMHTERVPGVEIRFVDYHWQPAIFEAMEKGTGAVPEATRNWVVVRVILGTRPLTLEGVKLPVGNYALALWPNLDGKGMAVEMRRVDMREVYPNVNAMAPAPKGETLYKGPARFQPLSPAAPRFDVSLAEGDGTVVLTLRYGDRRLPVTLTR
jgi:hypothetical protein